MSSIFSRISVDSAYKQISGEHINSLKQDSNAVQNTLEEIWQVYTVLKNDRDVYDFLNIMTSDPYVMVKAKNKVRQMKQINSYIESIFAYNNAIKEIINMSSRRGEPDELPEIKLLTEPDIKADNLIIPRKVEYMERKRIHSLSLITMTFNETFSGGTALRSSIIINLDEDKIQDTLMKAPGSTIMAVDAQGLVFLHPDPEFVAESILQEPYFKEIIGGGADSGSFSIQIDRQTSQVTFFRNENLGLYFIGIRPYSSIAGEIDKKRNQVIIFSMAVLLLFSMVGFILSRKLYSPIRSMEIKNREDAFKLKEDFLRKLLKNANMVESDKNGINELGIGIDFDNLIAAAVKIDGFSGIGPEKMEAIESSINSIIRGALEKDFICEVINMYEGEIAVLLNYRDSETNSFPMLLNSMEKVRDAVSEINGVSITVGIGGVAGSMDQCSEAYDKALEMVKYRFSLGYGNIIHDRMVEENLVSGVNYPEEIEEKLTMSMMTNQKVEFEGLLDDIIGILKSYKYYDAIVIIFQLMLACIKILNRIADAQKKRSMDFDEFNRRFNEMQIIEQSRAQMIDIFNEYQLLSEDLNKMKGDKHYKAIEEIKAYIDANYSSTALGAEMLAELSGYTTNYFAKIFKEITGVYIIDYIRQVRINKAKELLKNRSLKINDISDMAGFITTSYFYSAFKKEVGLTPASFRNLITDASEK